MADTTTLIKQIEHAVSPEIDRLIDLDIGVLRIRDADAFKWLTLNNLRIRLSRLDAQELAKLATMSGAEIMARYPGPTP
jgi:hypothetical protein